MSTGDVELHGWVYNIGEGSVEAFDESKGAFVSVQERYTA
jgi:carbonic anhydrase